MAFETPRRIFPIRTQHTSNNFEFVSELDTDRAYKQTYRGQSHHQFYLIPPRRFQAENIKNDCYFHATLHFFEVNSIVTVKANTRVIIQANRNNPDTFERCVLAELAPEYSENPTSEDDPLIFYFRELEIHNITQLELDNQSTRDAIVLLCELKDTISRPPAPDTNQYVEEN